MEGHATNVHYFGGVQFQQFGFHHVEIYLEDELRLRFPLPVVRVVASKSGGTRFRRPSDARARPSSSMRRYARQRNRIKIISSNSPPPGK